MDVPTLRPAGLGDVQVLVDHRRLMWIDIGEFSAADLANADAVYRRWVRTRLRSGRLVAWIVETDGEPVASGALWIQRVQPRPLHPSGANPYLLSMYTAPAHRGKGHAKRIVTAAMKWTKENGYPRATLHASRQGRPVYEALGWVPTPEMKWDAPKITPRGPSRSPHAGPPR